MMTRSAENLADIKTAIVPSRNGAGGSRQ
jgi:hypothetical protein